MLKNNSGLITCFVPQRFTLLVLKLNLLVFKVALLVFNFALLVFTFALFSTLSLNVCRSLVNRHVKEKVVQPVNL